MKKDALKPPGPGTTRKAEAKGGGRHRRGAGTVDEAELKKIPLPPPVGVDDGMDVSLETPGPLSRNHFMPPPPSTPEVVPEGELDPGPVSNMAYEDLLAKLVLPSKTPSVIRQEAPVPPPFTTPPTPTDPLSALLDDTSASSSGDERTLVTENPLLAEEQQTAVREGRSYLRSDLPTPLVAAPAPLPAPPPALNVPPSYAPPPFGAMPGPTYASLRRGKSKMYYLVIGGGASIVALLLVVLGVKWFGSDEPTPLPKQFPKATATLPEKALPPPAVEPVPAPSEQPPPEKTVTPEPIPEVAKAAVEKQPVVSEPKPAKAKAKHSSQAGKVARSSPVKKATPSATPKKASKSKSWADPFAD